MGRRLLRVFLFLILVQIGFAQEKPQARKVDEFGKLNCEDFWARIDGFHNELVSQPNAIGYTVINRNSQNKSEVILGLRRRNQTIGLLQRRLPSERFRVVKGDSEDFSIELWIVPPGSKIPFEYNEDWRNDFPEVLKPTVYSKPWMDDGVCPPSSEITFAEMIINNRNLSGHIVIFAPTKKKFDEMKKEVLEDFAAKYNLPANRLRFFFDRQPQIVGLEYWLVPKRRKS